MTRLIFPALLLFSLFLLSCQGPTGPQGEGEQSLTDPGVPPSILTTYPLNRSTGPYTDYNNRVTIRFNKIMDRTSVKRALHLTSPLGDVQVDSTSVSVTNTDVFTIAPLDIRGSAYKFYWKIGTVYTVTIDTSAFDINGNHLTSQGRMSFTPEPYFRVTAVTPVNGSTEVATASTVTLSFNSQVDSTISSHLAVTPAISGRWGYVPAFPAPDSTQYRYTYQGAGIDTVYVVTMDSAAQDKYGRKAGAAFRSVFTTATFRLSATTPTTASTGVSVFNAVKLTFTAPVDTSTVRGAITITPAIPGSYSYSPAGSPTVVTFTPAGRFAMNTTYTFTVSDSLKSLSGARLSQPAALYFTTTPFQVTTTSPANGATGVAVKQTLQFTFSDILDTSTIRRSVVISPAIPLKFTLTDSSTSFSIAPATQYADNTSYLVVLSGGIHSTRGDSLPIDYGYVFSTVTFGISTISPAANSANVALTRQLAFTFNAPIDTGTFRTAFTLSPPATGKITFSSDFTTATFTPAGWASATGYTAGISTTLRAQDSTYLSAPVQSSFSTAAFVVSSTSPADGAVNVAPTSTGLNISFNGPLDTTGIAGAVTITPSVNGYVSANEGATMLSYNVLDPTYLPRTAYTVTVSGSVGTIGGGTLQQPYQFSFRTRAFSVTSSDPVDGSVGVPRGSALMFTCSTDIDTSSVRGAFSITPQVDGDFATWSGPTNTIYFYPSQPLDSLASYTVRLSTGLRSVFGDTAVVPYTVRFTTGR